MGLYKYLLLVLNVVALTVIFLMTWEGNMHVKTSTHKASLLLDDHERDRSAELAKFVRHADMSQIESVQASLISRSTVPTNSHHLMVSTLNSSNYEIDVVHKSLNERAAEINRDFSNHPSHHMESRKSTTLEEYMLYLAKREQCRLKPM